MILNIYKEKGWTSFDVVAKLRSVLKTKRIGHAGTLDPLAEGVLIVLTDKDTKKQDEVMHQEKEYLADITFGVTSPTYDLEGDLSFSESLPSEAALMAGLLDLLSKYIGTYEQTLPPYSAKKQNGKKLYELARENALDLGALPNKEVTVTNLSIEKNYTDKNLSQKELPAITLKITCASGFYVRSLAHDLGVDLGCGAVLTKLVRTRVGEFKVEDSVEIEDFIIDKSIPGFNSE